MRVDALNLEARNRLETDASAALELSQQAHRMASQIGFEAGLAQSAWNVGRCNIALGELENSIPHLVQASNTFGALGASKARLDCLVDLARVHRDTGNLDAANTILDACLTDVKAFGDEPTEANILNLKSSIHHMMGMISEATQNLDRVLLIRRATRDRHGEAVALVNLGILYITLGNYTQSLDSLFQAYSIISQELEDQPLETRCLLNIGSAFQDMGDYPHAVEYFERASEVARRSNDRVNEVICLNNLAEARFSAGEHRAAVELFEQALGHAREIGLKHLELFILNGLGKTHGALGDHRKAIGFHQSALEYAARSGDQEGRIDALMGLGAAALGLSDPETATVDFGAALELGAELGHAKATYEAHRWLADAFERQGQLEHAITHLKAYHRLEREVLNQETARQTQNLALQLELERAHRDAELYRVRNEIVQSANEMLEQKVKERTQELEEARVEIVMRLALAAEYRDDSTGKHTLRVGQLSALIAQELGWDDDQVELIKLAARLHDVGKIGISDLIMLKPGKLSPPEFERIKTHTTIGAQMLSGGRSPLLRMAEEIAASHHERWDGSGYPHGIGQETIPITGRIVAVADVFDALVSQRTYKTAWTTQQAQTEIIRQSKAQFDPRVVAAFQKVLENASWADFDAPTDQA